ncbi:diguanylate cyclase [Alteromonas gracilis]|uniref:diguanylate cyclase n=1 Tax=Alteromonas gracilis TaxID=1479524 RepID=UPI0037354A47
MKSESNHIIQAFKFAPLPVLIFNEDGNVKLVNEQWTEITGYTPKDIPTISRWVELAYRDNRKEVQAGIEALFEKHRVVKEGEFKIRTKSGELRTWDFSSGPLGVDEQGCRMAISMAVDITEHKALEKQLRDSATKDSLTKLTNRTELMRKLKKEINRAKRYNHPVSLMFLDLDNFKQANDTHGHLVGDKLLIKLAKVLENSLRVSDFTGRYGGEEFIVVLPETRKDDAIELGKRLCKSISKDSFALDDITLNMTASIGIASFPDDGENYLEIIDVADGAMYDAKALGKNRVQSS